MYWLRALGMDGVLGWCKTKIDYMTHQGMQLEYVSAGPIISKIPFQPTTVPLSPLFLPQLSLCHKFSLQLYVHKDNFFMNRLWSLFYWGQKNKKLHCRRKDLDKTYRYGFVVVTLFFSRKYLKWVMSAIPNGFGSILSEVKEKCFMMIFKKSFMWFQT